MPFIGPSAHDPRWWSQVWTVDLRQKIETKPRTIEFEVLSEFGFSSRPGEPGPDGTPYWRSSAVDHRVPASMSTDLATVPKFLWGIVASYGRQTLPAILHDMLCYASALPSQPRAFRRKARREADTLFRETLRDSGSGVVRRWLMWAGVRLGGRPLVAVVAVVLAIALIPLLILIDAWRAPLTAAVLATSAVLLVLIALASREADRTPHQARRAQAEPATASASAAAEYGPTRFDPAAFRGLLGAVGLAVVAGPLLIPVTVITLVTRAILGIGERRLPPGFTGAPDPTTGLIPEGASARIEWVPLQPAADRTHPAPPATPLG